MATVTSALDRVKAQFDSSLPPALIEQTCKEAGHAWRWRLFDPIVTIQLFILQMLHGNTAITHLRHLAGRKVNAAAYCRARMRLPVAVLERLLEHLALVIMKVRTPRLWCGLQVFLVDASCAIAPDTSDNQKHFPQPKGQKIGCGFPVPKLVGLFDAFTGVIVKVVFGPLYTHDLRKMPQVHPALKKGDLLVGDRAYCSFAHFALLAQRGVLALFRAQPRQVSFKRKNRRGKRQRRHAKILRKLEKNDYLVVWKKPGRGYCPAWMSQEQYDSLADELVIRELRYKIPAQGQRTRVVTIATTLVDPALYPAEKIADLYGLRWRVETHFAELKTTLKMRQIKCQTAAGIQKEILMYCLVYNLVHAVMLTAAARQKVDADRISFVDTLRWVLTAAPGEELPPLVINPHRQGRHQPRVVKDRRDGYQRMTVPRSIMNRHPYNYPGRK